jgi:hypothetical protein
MEREPQDDKANDAQGEDHATNRDRERDYMPCQPPPQLHLVLGREQATGKVCRPGCLQDQQDDQCERNPEHESQVPGRIAPIHPSLTGISTRQRPAQSASIAKAAAGRACDPRAIAGSDWQALAVNHGQSSPTTALRWPSVSARALPRDLARGRKPLSRDRTRCPRCPASRGTTRSRHRQPAGARVPRRARPAARIRPQVRPRALHPRARCRPARQGAAGS